MSIQTHCLIQALVDTIPNCILCTWTSSGTSYWTERGKMRQFDPSWQLGHCHSVSPPKLESDTCVLTCVGVCCILLSTTNSQLTLLTTQDIYHHCHAATTAYLHHGFILIHCDSDKHSCALQSQHLSACFYPVIHAFKWSPQPWLPPCWLHWCVLDSQQLGTALSHCIYPGFMTNSDPLL